MSAEDLGSQAQHEAIASDNAQYSNLEQEWEVEKIIGEETKAGKLYYMVKWAPSLVVEEDMRNAAEVVGEWQKMKKKVKVRAKRAADRKGVMCAKGAKGAKGAQRKQG
ncbi:Chromo domain-like protein [Akanthomyces lecanii RCEF 1005]|uniref:Chromo domain-like protein n=1 Tax=Akanthomyces lecanii RCEF 1005 TaxID=1081108 RepID=A0A167Q6H7_CORDF|nr:Chromo domain-like protein [Akanthomyces lecanii RCEF 1005]